MIIDSIFHNDPTILIEHRSFFNLKQKVPSEPYRVEFGKCEIRQRGKRCYYSCRGVWFIRYYENC